MTRNIESLLTYTYKNRIMWYLNKRRQYFKDREGKYNYTVQALFKKYNENPNIIPCIQCGKEIEVGEGIVSGYSPIVRKYYHLTCFKSLYLDA